MSFAHKRFDPGTLGLVSFVFLMKMVLLAVSLHRRPDAFTYVDTGTYVRPALALIAHGTFSPSPEAAPTPEINRTPGYPLLVAAGFSVFGQRPWVLPTLGALCAAATALTVAGLAVRLFGRRAGWIAAAIVSLEPGSFLRSLDALSDPPFTLLLTLFWASLAAWGLEPSPPTPPLGAGVWLAFATLVRPLSYYLIPVAAVAVAFKTRRAKPLRAVAGFLLAPVLLVGGWRARNYVQAGTSSLSPISDSHILFMIASAAESRATGVPIPELLVRYGDLERRFRSGGGTEEEIFGGRPYEELNPETSRLPYKELSRRWKAKGLAIIEAHPVLTLRTMSASAFLVLLTPSTLIPAAAFGFVVPSARLLALYNDQRAFPFLSTLAHEAPTLFALSAAHIALLLALWVLAAAGVRRSWRPAPRWVHVVLLATFGYVLAVSSHAESRDERFRLPLVPIAAVYASCALLPRET